ncbi:hypothetical protein B0T22DRAFT_175697 [Podospora appendiculata]|uniref:1-phosphatidylinositol-4-phosphate 5-kinase n=1 Tax=Podospora appendiculata TaxID=314037 RepID=A0AAE0XBP4_9PEZI|nr:hypothetical protein B0T22DRAFT_175697 [Podospora appendiculata]
MHLSPEMPSFLTDENSPIYSPSSGIVHLDPAAQYGLSNEKVNGQISRQPQSDTSNESFDESSSHSTHTSEVSDTRRQVNGDYPWPPSMNTLANRDSGRGANGVITEDLGSWKPLPNGGIAVVTDRTRPRSTSVRDAEANDGPGPGFNEAHPRVSVSSTTGGSVQQSPVEMYLHPANKGDARIVENGPPTLPAIPSHGALASFPAISSPSFAPGATSPESGQSNQQSHHRYSSPPVYNTLGSSPTSSGALQPPPPGVGIKHRHTLEVPKVSSGRGSRDGTDTAFSSGRFSPTGAVGGRRGSLSLARRNTRSLHSDMPRDEIMPDEDVLRWTEAYRQKRASKRKKREVEDDDRVLVGTKVDEKHANWVTAYNMLTGIRVSVSRTNAKLDRDLTDADFEAKQKSTFDIAGNELVPSAKYDFKFKDYAPWVFRHLRRLFRLDPADYLMSLTGKYILSELGSPGKSGSFFYFSRDYKYIIKTIHHAEHKFLRKILKDYYQHVTNNPNTLLSQFYGLHRVKMPYGKKIHFVVMNNLFPPHRDIHQTFDLKGSTVGREYKEDDLGTNSRATLKDLNWLRRQQHLEFGLHKKKLFLEQLQKDVVLLQRLKIMDYSLLVGIHDAQRGNEENLRGKTLRVFNPGGSAPEEYEQPHSVLMRTPSKLETQRKARELRQMIKSERPVPMGETGSQMPDELGEGQNRPGFVFNQDDGGFRATHEDNTPADEIYYLGVIDCLTHYGIIKKLEHFWKGFSNDRHQISALPPQEYGERFFNFISGITMSPEEAARVAQEKDAAAAAAAAAEERERLDNDNAGRRSSSAIPPVPNYSPPPPPTSLPAERRSPQVEATLQKAEHEARKSERHGGVSEEDIPDRTLRTTVSPPAGSSGNTKNAHGHASSPSERLANQASILPVVEETAECTSTGNRSRNSHASSLVTEDDFRPLTPAKDGEEREAGFGNPLLRGHGSGNKGRGPPPTPPKSAYGHGALKPESADSGYGFTGSNGSGSGNGDLRSATGSQKSGKVRPQLSRDSLDKALPPLPGTL